MDGADTVSVAEAAARLGLSTLKVRAHLHAGHLSGFRDNRGHWHVRLDVAALPTLTGAADDRQIIDLLLEEVLELRDQSAGQEETIARLAALVEKQQAMLERALAAREAARPDDALQPALTRALALAEQALTRAEAERARAEQRIRARDVLLERALGLMESMLREAEAPKGERRGFDWLKWRGGAAKG